MATGIRIYSSSYYAKYDGTITLSLRGGTLPANYTYCRFVFYDDGVWSTSVGGGDKTFHITIKIDDVTSATKSTQYVKFKACFMTSAQGSIGGWTDNEITVWLTHDLEKPQILSITPKSPKITEQLRIQCKTVANADYYSLEAMWQNPGSAAFQSKNIRNNISAEELENSPYIYTTPSSTLDGIGQNGMLYYRLKAYSNDKRYTPSTGVYTAVNLNLASNLRFKLGGNWVRGKPYIKVGGQWRRAVKTFVKINGAWKNA